MAPAARAGDYTLTSLLDSQNPVSGVSGQYLEGIEQVVSGPGGTVAVEAQVGNADNSNNAIVYVPPGQATQSDANASVIAQTDGSTVWNNPNGTNDQWSEFYNLSLGADGSGNTQLTFAADGVHGSTTDIGVFQKNVTNLSAADRTLLYSGGSYLGGTANFNGNNVQDIAVAPNGPVAFQAYKTSTSTNTIASSNSGTISAAFPASTAAPVIGSSNLSVTSAGAPVYLATNGQIQSLAPQTASPPPSNAAYTRVGTAVTWTPGVTQYTYHPTLLLAATASDTLFVGETAGSSQGEVFLQQGVVDGTSAGTPVGIAGFTGAPSESISGEVSPNNGYAAFTAPGSGGNLQVDYAHPSGSSVATTPVAVPGGSVDGQTIDSILPADQAPVMVNDNGVVAFSADLGPTSDSYPDGREALVAWTPSGGLKLVAEQGDEFYSITGADLGPITGFNDNALGGSSATNLYNDELSDSNVLAFGVYNDTGTQDVNSSELFDFAVLSATIPIPEPASIGVLVMVALPLLARRRRTFSR